MIPLKAARRIKSTPVVTYLIVAVNVLVFLWQMTLDTSALDQVYLQAGFIPCSGDIMTPTLLSSLFLHGGFFHLLGNMIFLLAVGPAVEDYLGKFWFSVFYLAAGVGGGLLHAVFHASGVCLPVVGASGAVMGVMGGFLLLYPGTRITSLLLFGRIPIGVQHIPALYVLAGFFVWDVINGIASLNAPTVNGGVAFWAHVGGFLVGFLMAFIGMTFKPLPPVDPTYSD